MTTQKTHTREPPTGFVSTAMMQPTTTIKVAKTSRRVMRSPKKMAAKTALAASCCTTRSVRRSNEKQSFNWKNQVGEKT